MNSDCAICDRHAAAYHGPHAYCPAHLAIERRQVPDAHRCIACGKEQPANVSWHRSAPCGECQPKLAAGDDYQHPKWQKRRLEIMQRDDWKCRGCGSGDKMLQVHHRRYARKLWDAPDHDLVTLCVECHAEQHPTGA